MGRLSRRGAGAARPLVVLLLACTLALLAALVQAQPAPEAAIPALDAPVVDTTGTLDAAVVQRLVAQAQALQQRKGSQLQVLVVSSTGPDSIEQYADRVFQAWKLDRGGVDDGVLLLVATDDRAVRIETGYGLEGAIPDAVANRVIQEYLVPKFRAGDYAGGIEDATAVLVKIIDGEPLPAPVSRNRPVREPDRGSNWLPALFIAFVVAQVLRGLMGGLSRPVRAPLVASAAGGAAWLVSSALAVGLLGVAIGLVVSLLGNIGGGFARGGGGGGWGGGWGGGAGGGSWGGGWGSGSWGGGAGGGRSSGRSGGSGGGWSGGGGRSGGGGASGRW